MKITKGKVIGVVMLLLLCLPFIIGKESKVKGFPVSIFSSHVEGRYPQEYKYTAFLPDFAVWINGWEKKWTEGERTVYQKGERTVNVFHPPGDDGYYLYEEGEYAK